jgi:hypothetical protein
MCKEATITIRVKTENKKPDEEKIITVDNEESKRIPIDEQSKMLCNAIVQATYELHVNQKKNRDDIQVFLKNDCQKLETTELVRKVKKEFLRMKKPKMNLFL